jgi:hypothetical protein
MTPKETVPPAPEETVPPKPKEPTPPAAEQSETPADEGPLVVSYEDGMVAVHIEEGSATVTFDHELWDNRYGIYHSNVEFWDYLDLLQEGPFPITGLKGKVIDACVAQMSNFFMTSLAVCPDPVVILLMEDGTVYMSLVDPGTWMMDEDITYESWRVPWLEDIVSLSYGVDSQSDYGNDMTVYAVDSRGLRYNVRIPASYSLIMDKELYAALPPIDEFADDTGDYMTLTFSGDGTAVFQKFFSHDELYEIYTGTYEVQLVEEPDWGYHAGAVSFDLDLNWWIWEWAGGEVSAEDEAFWDAGQSLDGVYSSWIIMEYGEEARVYLTFSDGKGLVIYKDRRPPDDFFEFYSDKRNIVGYQNDDY